MTEDFRLSSVMVIDGHTKHAQFCGVIHSGQRIFDNFSHGNFTGDESEILPDTSRVA